MSTILTFVYIDLQGVLISEGIKMPLSSKDVPQADDINRVISAVKCLYCYGYVDCYVLSVVERQVSYYLNAARILGLVDNQFCITQAGINVARSNNPYLLVAAQFKCSYVYQEWSAWSLAHGSNEVKVGTARDFLADHFTSTSLPKTYSLTDNVNGTGTISRRAKTLDGWHSSLHPYM